MLLIGYRLESVKQRSCFGARRVRSDNAAPCSVYFFAFRRAISDAGSVDGARFIGSAPVG